MSRLGQQTAEMQTKRCCQCLDLRLKLAVTELGDIYTGFKDKS